MTVGGVGKPGGVGGSGPLGWKPDIGKNDESDQSDSLFKLRSVFANLMRTKLIPSDIDGVFKPAHSQIYSTYAITQNDNRGTLA